MSSPSNRFAPLPPPPAPPLPPEGYSQKAVTAIARITQPLFFGQRTASWQHAKTAARLSRGYDAATSFSSSTIRGEAVHKTGLQISAIDISPYRTHAILAGRDILKTIRVDDFTCVEDINLRSRITAYASTHDRNRDAITAQHRDQLVAADVKWSHGSYDSTIATAAANGRIVIYDLNRPSVEIARLHEHTRQVHRIAFNPHQGALLLSASQDGTTRLWDLRALGSSDAGGRSVRTCNSHRRFSANTQGVRDVQWSPEDGYVFAIGTENGVIQKWTLAKDSSPLLRLHGHDYSCSSISWHPEGRFLASASAENLVKVWDFGNDDRRMKPISIIRTPQAVMNVKWRPVAGDEGGNFDSTAAQLSTSYDAKDPRIHVWDLQRPSVPVLEVDKYDTPATGMVWYSRDLLWTVGNTGTFTQNDLTRATEPSTRHGSALAIDPTGRMAFFSTRNLSKHTFHSELAKHQIRERQVEQVNSIKDISPEHPSSESLLSRRRRRTEDMSINESFGSAVSLEEDRSKKLEELKAFLCPSFSSPQLATIIGLQSVSNSVEFVWLAEHYRLPSRTLLVGRDPAPHQTIETAFEENATLAELVGDIRLAQTWRIVGFAVRNELHRRLEVIKTNGPRPAKVLIPKVDHEKLPNKSEKVPVSAKTINKSIQLPTSSLSTPLARPRQNLSMPLISLGDSLDISSTAEEIEDSHKDKSSVSDEVAEAIAALESKYQEGGEPRSALDISLDEAGRVLQEHESGGLSTQFAEFEAEMKERRNALGDYRARPRTVLSLDTPYNVVRESSPINTLDRYDSNESFQMFSASADSDRQSFPTDGFPDEQRILSQTSDSSLKKGLLSNYKKWKADHLEGSGQTTPQIIEPRQSVDNLLPHGMEHHRTTKTNNASRASLLQRPIDDGPKIHTADFWSPEVTDADANAILPPDILNFGKEEDPVPWDIYSLLQPLLEFHIDVLGDCQLPTMLALWLWQYFPSEFERPQITALALFYQRRLADLELFKPLAQLRKKYSLLFPEVLEQTTGSQAVPLFCRTCNKTYESDESSTCPRCKNEIANCSICEAPTPPPSLTSDSPSDTNLWSWCQGCGHGGHASCLSTWFSAAEVAQGTCPILGCAHDCVAGERREQVVADIEAQRRRSRKTVVKDEWTVNESRAVEKARDIVGVDKTSSKRGGKAATTSSTTASSIKADPSSTNTSTRAEAPARTRRVRLKIGGDSTT